MALKFNVRRIDSWKFEINKKLLQVAFTFAVMLIAIIVEPALCGDDDHKE